MCKKEERCRVKWRGNLVVIKGRLIFIDDMLDWVSYELFYLFLEVYVVCCIFKLDVCVVVWEIGL